MGEGRGLYRVLVGKPEGKTSLERPRLRWEDNIKKDLKEMGCWGMDWIELAHLLKKDLLPGAGRKITVDTEFFPGW